MIGVFLALLTAMVYGLAIVLVRKRLEESTFFSVSVVLAVTGSLIFWPLSFLFTDYNSINLEGVLFFVAAGLLAPGIARLLYYKGMGKVGVAKTASVFATNPMYTSMFAVILLGESLTPENWVGILCIVAGVVFIERGSSGSESGYKMRFKKGLIFPLLAALTFAFSAVARKHGLNIYGEPVLGVAVSMTSALLLYLLLSISSHTLRGSLFSRRAFGLFWKAGVLISLGWVLSFFALSYERVSIVNSVIETEALFVLFFTHLILKELERVSLRFVVSTLFIVVGVMLVSIR